MGNGGIGLSEADFGESSESDKFSEVDSGDGSYIIEWSAGPDCEDGELVFENAFLVNWITPLLAIEKDFLCATSVLEVVLVTDGEIGVLKKAIDEHANELWPYFYAQMEKLVQQPYAAL